MGSPEVNLSLQEEEWRVRKGAKRQCLNASRTSHGNTGYFTPRPSRSSTPMPSSMDGSFTDNDRIYIARIANLPVDARTPRGLSQFLKVISNLHIIDLIPLRIGHVLVKSKNPRIVDKLSQLKQLIHKEVYITEEDWAPRTRAEPRPASFSCVLTRVDHDIPLEEIENQLHDSGIKFKKIWRIISRATNKETRLIRITTTDKESLQRLLTTGVHIWNRHHRAEESHPPKPQPYQCQRCQGFHDPGACKLPLKCRHCSGPHHFSNCPMREENPRCSNCNGPHPSDSAKCQQRPPAPTSVLATAPLVCVNTQEEKSAQPADVNSVLQFVTAAVLNAVPDQRPRMERILQQLAARLFQTKLNISYAGAKLYVGCSPLPTYSSIAQTLNG